jgi:hypothetical protein
MLDTQSERRLTGPLKVIAYVSLVLTAIAFVNLYVFADRTNDFGPWTITPAMSAAFLGAGYGAGFVLFLVALRDGNWARARIGVVTVWLFTVLILIATLRHNDRFHLHSGPLSARVAGWSWLIVYIAFPAVVAALIVLQVRTRGADPPVTRPMSRLLIVALAAQGAILLATGVALWVAPTRMSNGWPWPLTPLTGRAIGSWALALGFAAVYAIAERDLPRLRPAAITYFVFAVLELSTLARFYDDVRWDNGWTYVYIAVLVSIGGLGYYGLSNRAARASITP